MRLRAATLVRRGIRAVAYSALGAVLMLVVVFVVYLNSRADLDIWHLAELDEEVKAGSGVESFAEYLRLEERVFQQLDELVYAELPSDKRNEINRYNRGSLSDPERWLRNWNRSFELPAAASRRTRAGIVRYQPRG